MNQNNSYEETKMNHIQTNSDFLYLYEASKSNPNGDPDMENKPRMDYDTNTNLVSDLRIKRNIREYLKDSQQNIFVDTLSDDKVAVDTMLNAIMKDITGDDAKFQTLLNNAQEKCKSLWNELSPNNSKTYSNLLEIAKKKKADLNEEIDKKIHEMMPKLKNLLLEEIVKQQLIDIRMFGGAFPVEGFSRTFTGPIQLNWGYSLHPVELMKPNSIVTIMHDDSSTFGKDYRLYYSLIAFHGTINKHQAKKTGLCEDDVNLFRKAIFESISYKPTRSKSDQYSLFYIELKYKEDFNNYLGDLRQYVSLKQGKNPIRSYTDISLNFSELTKVIKENNQEKIGKIYYAHAPKFKSIFDKFKSETEISDDKWINILGRLK